MRELIKKISTVNKLLSESTKKYYPYLIFFTIFSSLFEILTIGAIMPVITIFIFPDILFEIQIVERLYIALNINFEQFRYFTIIVFFLLIIISTVSRVVLLYITMNLSKTITSDLSSNLFNSYIFKNYEEISSYKSNRIIANTTEKLEIFSNILFHFFTFFSSIFLSIAIIFSLIIFSNFYLILLLVFFVSFFYLILIFFTNSKLSKYSNYTNFLSNNRAKNLQDVLNNYKSIILENSMIVYAKRFYDLDYNFRKTQAKVSLIGFLPRFFIEAFSIILITGTTFFFLSKNSFENSSDIILSVGIIVFGAQKLLPIFQSVYLAFSSLKGNMGMISEIVDSISLNDLKNQTFDKSFTKDFSSMELKNINFTYKNTDQPILTNVNLTINKGDKIGIIGQSGSGKSTLVDIIMGLLKPTAGKIILNNSNINFDKDKFKIRNNFSHVPQNYFILNETIKENILFSVSKEIAANENNLMKAISCSELNEFINNFESGVNTIIGDKGANISGGQRQRIALARAFYKEKNILVLDEATSSLDENTENKIIKNLNDLYPNLTLLFITHKKNLLKNFNKTINLDE